MPQLLILKLTGISDKLRFSDCVLGWTDDIFVEDFCRKGKLAGAAGAVKPEIVQRRLASVAAI